MTIIDILAAIAVSPFDWPVDVGTRVGTIDLTGHVSSRHPIRPWLV